MIGSGGPGSTECPSGGGGLAIRRAAAHDTDQLRVRQSRPLAPPLLEQQSEPCDPAIPERRTAYADRPAKARRRDVLRGVGPVALRLQAGWGPELWTEEGVFGGGNPRR